MHTCLSPKLYAPNYYTALWNSWRENMIYTPLYGHYLAHFPEHNIKNTHRVYVTPWTVIHDVEY